jgi:K+-sensing histidine kinase KdpD
LRYDFLFPMAESSKPSPPEIQVSMPEVVKFIRQLAHDLRNHLNAAELQSAYLIEIAENSELRDEIKRLRGMIGQVGVSLQELTAALSQPRLTKMPYAAKDLIEDLQQKLATDYPEESARVKWHEAAGDATLDIDPQLLLSALLELFANAFHHDRADGVISAMARTENGRFTFTLSEPKRNFERSTEHWGREPLRALGQGHYGLGLHRTRAIIEAHGAEFAARHDKDSSSLVTTVTFLLAAADA